MAQDYKKPLPYIHEETRPYWEGAKKHELRIQRCRICGRYYFYPRDFCPVCFSFDVEWVRVSGRGTVYSYTICERGAPGFEEDVPYNLAIIELEEGPRMMSNLVDCPEGGPEVGMAAEVVFDDVTEEVTLPKFRPIRRPK